MRETLISISIISIVLLVLVTAFGPKQTVEEENVEEKPQAGIEIEAGTSIDVNEELIRELAVEHGLNPELVLRIVDCESGGYPEAIGYNKRDGVVWSLDHGPLQVNDYYHADAMASQGRDITDPYDSLQYGLEMMAVAGTSPWSASRHCWNV